MTTIDDVIRAMESIAPPSLAADWDNVGLLVGDRGRPATRVMTCLTTTAAVVEEAITQKVELIVSHHPLPFKPQRTFTTDTLDGRLLWVLARAGISLYSPHTAFDSAAAGINQILADGLKLRDVAPLESPTFSSDPNVGVGRWGRLVQPTTVDDFARRVKALLRLEVVEVVGAGDRPVSTVGIACGSAGELLAAAASKPCDLFITGEARFHTALEAEARDTAMILMGHYAGERIGVEELARMLSAALPELKVWPSRNERDPLRRV